MAYAKSEETKRKLLRTTMRLLRTQGFNATGISQILSESGVPKGSLYHHFPMGKIELTTSAVKLANRSILKHLNQINESVESAEDTVRIFFDYYINEMEQGSFKKGCPIATVTLEAAAFIQPIQVACEATFNEMQEHIALSLVSDGVQPGDAETLAYAIIAGYEGALVMSKAQKSTKPLAVIRDNLIQQVRSASNLERVQ